MRHPSAGPHGRGHLTAHAGNPRWLLVGNSRWHWAEADGRTLRVWHETPPVADPRPVPVGWAAVGRLPSTVHLPADRRLALEAVPLAGVPPWLGVDRALAGWQAWCEADSPVLVVDAGTVLSFTRVDGRGRFRGGRLQAGVALQLSAMAAGTAALPMCLPPQAGAIAGDGCGWPSETSAAMEAGVLRGLAAAILQAAREATAEEPSCTTFLTGGDAPVLADLIARDPAAGNVPWMHRPALCLEALVRLRPSPPGPAGVSPDPGPRGPDRPSPRLSP